VNLIVRQDKKIADYVLKRGKSYIIVVNKIDLYKGDLKELESKIRYNFPHVNFVKILFVSAKEKTGLEELMEYIVDLHNRVNIEWKTSVLNRFLEDLKEAKQVLVKTSYLNLLYYFLVLPSLDGYKIVQFQLV